MRKIALILLLFFPLIFSGCVSTNELESRGKQTVKIENDCNWAIKLNIRLNDFSGYKICSLDLGKEPKTIELYKDTEYVFEIKGAYDHTVEQHVLNYKDQTYIVIDWSTYTAKYRLRGR